MRDTLLILRVHEFDAHVEQVYRKLVSSLELDVCVVADETRGKVHVPEGVRTCVMSVASLDALGVAIPERAGWVCGDYAIYTAMLANPPYDFYWMLEPDVFINFEDAGEFFGWFERNRDVDLIAAAYGPAHRNWPWTRTVEAFSSPVYACLFPVVRLSRKAAAFLLGARQQLAQRRPDLTLMNYPNDEVFCATVLTNSGHVCHGLNAFGREMISADVFGHTRVFPFHHMERAGADGMVYHPVLTAEKLYDKFLTAVEHGDAETFLHTKRFVPHSGDDLSREQVEHLRGRIEARDAAHRHERIDRRSGIIVRSSGERGALFWVEDKREYVQSVNLSGRFYEEEYLRYLEKFDLQGGVLVDVGANVGNHTLFAIKYLGVAKCVPVEPLPRAREVFDINMRLNGCSARVDARHVKGALLDERGTGRIGLVEGNWGASRAIPGEDPSSSEEACVIDTGDNLLRGEEVSLLKIDVPEDSFRVLAGFRQTLLRWRPVVYVSVPDREHAAFLGFVQEIGYAVDAAFDQYQGQKLCILVPARARRGRMRRSLWARLKRAAR